MYGLKTLSDPTAVTPALRSGPNRSGISSLTPREHAVLSSWIRHGVYKLVAYDLGISEQTVKNYATSIFEKLGVRSIGQAAVIWDRIVNGFLVERRTGQRRSGEERRVTPG